MALASEVIARARTLLQDEDSVRWPLPELLRWLIDAQRDIVLNKPSAKSDNRVIALVEGTYQAIPGDATALIRVVRNIRSVDTDGRRVGGQAVSPVARSILDAQHRDWHDGRTNRFKKEARHVTFDEDDRKSFYVYPGNDGTGQMEVVVAITPGDIAIAADADPNDIGSYALPIGLDDIYVTAMVDWICYRAYAKDAQYAGNTQRAQLHFQQFANALGIKANMEMLKSPNFTAGIKATASGDA
ncbi:hypothetical protein EDF57_10657 [Novosphingobium sp. PhB55]|uniref:phage adaptor protein n=1 Tax=Novosphingobium sp. PhB55 TaxID=2485106 RepID=UPI0010667AE7|nr:DUF6682 family protein [Novosphingobium sp. PhB55]TDW63102.1 hypothetical protein EDF57_10657 [Novosphingobium sp. PhB55]